MIEAKRSRARKRGHEINIAPLIDMVFILLIFFIVTANFNQESGIEIQRPTAQSSLPIERNGINVLVTKANQIHIDNQRVSAGDVRSKVQRQLARLPGAPVVILADHASDTGVVMKVYDACLLAGAKRVALSTRKEGP